MKFKNSVSYVQILNNRDPDTIDLCRVRLYLNKA